MPNELADFKFHENSIFAGDTGVIDFDNHIIRGVSVITGGIEAEGHDLLVDDTTLKQLQACAKAKGKIPVCLDHGSGVKDLNGYLVGFRMDGNKLRADWHMLAKHEETEKMLERAEKMPECFGLSVAFKGPPKGVPVGGGKMAARCERLLSVDCVTRPAANAGLFSIPEVDNRETGMPTAPNADPNANAGEPTMAQILQAIEGLNSRLDEHENFLGQIQSANQPQPTLEDLHNASDEELASLGITRDEVNAAVAEAVEAMEAEAANANADADPNAVTGADTEAGSAVGAATGGADASAPATFKALVNEVVALRNHIQARELAEVEAEKVNQLSEIDKKISTLAEQRDAARAEAIKLAAKCETLEVAFKTGTKPVAAGVNEGERMFGATEQTGELHPFQARVKQLMAEKSLTEGAAVIFAQKEDPQSHALWVKSLPRK